jgi:hypothetical protein
VSISVAILHGGGQFCPSLADFANHPGRCHRPVLTGGPHGGGFEVGACLLCEVWNLVGRSV